MSERTEEGNKSPHVTDGLLCFCAGSFQGIPHRLMKASG